MRKTKIKKITLVLLFLFAFTILLTALAKHKEINIPNEEFGVVQYKDDVKIADGTIKFEKTTYPETGEVCYKETDFVNGELMRTAYVLPNGDCLFIEEENEEGIYRKSIYEYNGKRGKIENKTEFNGEEKEYDMSIPKIDDVEARFDKGTLPLVFRGFPFDEHRAKMVFRFIMPKFKDGEVHRFYVKNLGKETITVSAGTFECYKLEMGILGFAALVYPHKNYFWYTVEEPHHYVRYQGVTGKGYNSTTVNEITSYKILD